MYSMLLHSHSGLRWVVLILLLLAVVNNGMKWQSGKTFTEKDRKLNLFAMIFSHIQLLIGIGLVFMSPKMKIGAGGMNEVARFLMTQHMTWMVVAIILVTFGYIRSKRLIGDKIKFKAAFIPHLLALVAILYAIPWPGRGYGGSWF